MTATTTRPRRTARARTTDRSGRFVVGILQRWTVFALCVVAWEVATSIAQHPYFPTPTLIVETMYDQWFSGPVTHLFFTDMAVRNVLPSLWRLLAGWAIGGVVGVFLGMALGRSRVALDYVQPLISFFRSMPAPALLPVFLVLFQLGTPIQLATIIFGVVWPVLLNTIHGAQSIHVTQVETARAFGLPLRNWTFMVVLPAALPKIFSGLRISLALSLVLMVISELTGATNGIGYQLQDAIQSFNLPVTWACIVLLGVIGNLLNWVFLGIERRALSWQYLAKPNNE